MVPDGVVDERAYPWADMPVAEHQRALRARGVSVLPGFVTPGAIAEIVAECDVLAKDAYHQDVQGTPYLELPDEAAYPDPTHPRRTWSRSSVHTVAYDRFAASSLIRQLYEDDRFLELLRRILDKPVLHRYADPLGALNLAVMEDGDELGWHFDQTDFVVSLAIQSADRGGDFENAANIRSGEDEHYDDVGRTLAGGNPNTVVEPMTPGTLMLFEGRRSLHRVTPIEGATPRYVALFGYDTKPGTMSTELLRLVRYGRAN